MRRHAATICSGVDRQPLAERDVREPDVAPLLDRAHDAGALARQADAGRLAEAEPHQRVGQPRRAPARRAILVAPMLLENLNTSATVSDAVRMRVVDRVLADHHPAHQAVEAVVGLHDARLERGGDGERLHRRPGLERVGDGAVARARRRRRSAGSFGL